jgi:Fe2+ transport system protein FeoA
MSCCETIEPGRMTTRYCPLSRVKAGMEVRIKQLCAPPEIARRLREIGFCEEQLIRLIGASVGIICLVCQARMALSPQLADMILVEPGPHQGVC